MILGLVFLVIEKVWQVWSYSKSWCIPNYQLSVSFKNSSFFCCLIFEEFEKKFLNQEFYGQLPEQTWLKGSFDFSKIVPFEAPRPFIQMIPRWKWVFVRMNTLPTMTTNSFKVKDRTIGKHFHFHFCTAFMITKFIPFFLKVSAKYIMTKASETKSIYFMQMLTSK